MKLPVLCPLGLLSMLICDNIHVLAGGGTRSLGGSTHVRGYFRKDGAYVPPHYRSAPDGSFYNNWTTSGNINPYTGEEGTKQFSG